MIKLFTFYLLTFCTVCICQNSLKLNYEFYGIKSNTSEEINNIPGYIEFFPNLIKFYQNGKVEIMEINSILDNNQIELKNSGKVYFESKKNNELFILELNNVKAFFYFKTLDKERYISYYNFKILETKNTISFENCDCKKIKNNNSKIIQCKPIPVHFNEKYQIGISVSYIDDKKYILLTLRNLNTKSVIINSDLIIITKDNSLLNLKLLDTNEDFISGSKISHAKFELTDKNLEILKYEKIIDLRFTLFNDNYYKSHKIEENNDVLFKQLNCLY